MKQLTCYDCWALSKQFDYGRYLLSKHHYGPRMGVSTGIHSIQTATFETRQQAREAQKTCYYSSGTRVEKVRVTIEIIK